MYAGIWIIYEMAHKYEGLSRELAKISMRVDYSAAENKNRELNKLSII